MGGMIGLQRAYPYSGFGRLLTPAGQAALDAGARDCTTDLILRYAFTPLSTFTVSSTPFDDPRLKALLADNSPLGHGAAPPAPVYSYHAVTDELVLVAVADRLVASYCAAGTPVEKVRYPAGEHTQTLLTAVPGAQDFLARRFEGSAVVDSCTS